MQVLDVWGKRILEYVPEALARLNRGEEGLVIRAISGNAAVGLGSAHILHREFDIEIECVTVRPFKLNEMETFCVEIALKNKPMTANQAADDGKWLEERFVDFPVYHLLLDWWLYEQGELQLFHYDKLLATIKRDGSVVFDNKANNRVSDALCRSGLLWPANWREVAERLATYDDVILGVDTNILFNCALSEHLLPALSLANHRGYVCTPNWVLFVVPSGVMHELEEAANVRDKGLLKTRGRMGFRALQEVIELNQNAGIPGVSLLITGEANPVLDTRIELQGLRADLRKSQQDGDGEAPRLKKSSSGDMIIRSQFKSFLRQLDFHKGAYFLTADKSNAALARAEGLCTIYVGPPDKKPPRIKINERQWATVRAPTGKLVYEMAVQYWPLTIRGGNRNVVVKCDAKGEAIDYWIYRKLEIERHDLERLRRDYKSKFSVGKAVEVWNRFIKELVKLDG